MEKKIIYTEKNADKDNITCSYTCSPRSEKEGCDVHFCCRFCDQTENCEDICFFIEDGNDYDNFCELEWEIFY